MFWVIVRLLNTCQRDKNIAHQMNIDTPSLIVWYRLIAQYLRLIAERAQKTAEKADIEQEMGGVKARIEEIKEKLEK